VVSDRRADQLAAQADRIAELVRERGVLTARVAGLERVRDAAMAYAAEVEEQLRAAGAAPRPERALTASPARPWWRRWRWWRVGVSLVLIGGTGYILFCWVQHASMGRRQRAR
jgi:hypothetical protein